jgi:hypothetical protein
MGDVEHVVTDYRDPLAWQGGMKPEQSIEKK